MKHIITFELTEEHGEAAKLKCTFSSMTDVESLDRVIAAIGQWRESVQPPVTQVDVVSGKELRPVKLTSWVVGNSPDYRPVLSLRHPGFGWLSFEIEPNDLRSLLEILRSLE